MHLFWLALAAFVAASINAVAGGGTFLTFPVLTGVAQLSAKAANITSTIGLWPGDISSMVAAHDDLRQVERKLVLIHGIISVIGGGLGAVLLLRTPEHAFALFIPWLLVFATLLFAFGKRIARWAGYVHGKRSTKWLIAVGLLQLAISVYGGYFGAGIGVLMLAGLSLTGLESIHQINALKARLTVLINGVACVVFAFSPFDRPAAGAMVVGALFGGFLGMKLARRIPPVALRGIIIGVGVGLSAYFFYRAYGHG